MPEIRVFNKIPATYQELIDRLKGRGLVVDDNEIAINFIKNISYYRLVGYGLPFHQVDPSGQRLNNYVAGTTFKQITSSYIVDRKIRTLLVSAIERTEVAIRSIINHEMACTYNNAHWYLDPGLFKETNSFKHDGLIKEVKRLTSKNAVSGSEREQRREVFIQHYYNSYDEPEFPPGWMIAEVLSLGSWSKIYENLKVSKDRKRISKQFDLAPNTLQSWLHALTYLRNICAHHSKLFGRKLVIRPSIAKNIPINGDNYLYNFVCITYWMLKRISPETTWLDRFVDVLDTLDKNHLCHYGFDDSWLEEPFWLDQ